MKKKCLLAGLMISMIGLTGCTSAISLSEDEENMVAEYLAEVALYDQDTYTEALVSPTPTPVPTATPTPTQSPEATAAPNNASAQGSQTETTANQQANADYVEVMGMSDLKAEYTGYEVKEAYTDESFNLQANKGYELLVIKFDVTSTAQKEQELNLGNKDITYMLDINTGTNVKPLITAKDNDLRYIDVKLEPNKKLQTVIMFEVKKGTKVKTANLIISRKDKTAIVKIK